MRRVCIGMCLSMACSRGAQQPVQSPAKVEAPQAEATLPAGTLLVADKAKAELFVFHLPTREPAATLPTGVGPHEIAMSDDGVLAVVSNYGEQRGALWVGSNAAHTISIVDVEAGRVTETIEASGIAFASDTLAFVSLARAGEVAVIDLTRNEITDHLDAGDHPDGIAFAAKK
jgi:DNA-binding beta-propeller fold protein YncE